MEVQGKPAVKSVTNFGIAGAAFFWALPMILRHLGFHEGDLSAVSQAVRQLADLGAQAAVPVGLIVAAWGRAHAKQPITGVFTAPTVPQQPAAELPPY